MRHALAAAVVACALVVVGAASAGAHARLVRSEPGSGQPLGADRVVTLTFDDPVDAGGSTLSVTTAGRAFDLTDLHHVNGDETTLAATVPANVTGSAALHWRALADDGHVSTGDLTLGAAGATAAHASVDRTGVEGALTVVRTLSFLALVVLVGGLAFVGGIWPVGAEVRSARTLLWGAWALGVVSTVAGIGLLGASTKRLGLDAAFHVDVIRDVLATNVGHVWAMRLLLYVLAVVVLAALRTQGAVAARSLGWRLGATAVGIALLRTPGLAAHATQGDDAVLGSVADLAHLIGAACWLGGLAMLAAVVLPRRDADELEPVVRRYSTVAFLSVLLIVGGGVVLTWQLVGGYHALVSTHYGHVLLVKVSVFAVLLVAAQRSKRWVEHRLDMAVILAADGEVVAPFVRSVLAEVALAAAVLTAAAVLVSTHPVR